MKRRLPSVLFYALFCCLSAPPGLADSGVKIEHCTLNRPLTVSFLSVGQGDAVLITCPDGITQALIDAGPSELESPGSAGLFEKALLPRLRGSVIRLAVNTHPHPDHLFGFVKLTSEDSTVKIAEYLDQGADNPATTAEEGIRARIAASGGTYHTIRDFNRELPLCRGGNGEQSAYLSFFPLTDEEKKVLGCPTNLNDCSLVTKLSYKEISFLFAADATLKWEKEAVKNPRAPEFLNTTVLKAGHHGASSTGEQLLHLARPSVVILSTASPSVGLPYPGAAVLKRLHSFYSGQGVASGEKQLQGCSKTCGNKCCAWSTTTLPGSVVLSTASEGTIDLATDGSRLCFMPAAAKGVK